MSFNEVLTRGMSLSKIGLCPLLSVAWAAWAELRHLPTSLGYVGAWSMPISVAGGPVLGTFGTYYRLSRMPTTKERKGVELLVAAAALVLAKPPSTGIANCSAAL